MSEFIVIQVGQCGNQIGSCLLPEILKEYDIKTGHEGSNKCKTDKTELQQFMRCFFNYNTKKCSTFDTLSDLVANKAKFLCIDMEDSVVARVKSGRYRDLFEKKCLITNYPGSGNNWAEGYHSHGPKFKEKILKTLQHTVDRCDNLNGFMLFFSMGGGTGSGLGSYIVTLLQDCYPKIERFVVCVYPTGTEDVITCPYNSAFATQELIENATCVFPVENRALLDIAFRQTRRYTENFNSILPFAPFEDLNKIVVDMILHLTSGSRFSGKMNVDMNDINTNMVPFPKLHFLSTGFSPFVFKYCQNNSNCLKNELFLASCSRSSQLVKLDPLNSSCTSMGVTLLGRGNYSVNDMRNYVDKLKNKLHFAPWSSKSVKVGLCDIPPRGTEFSMFSLSNTTSVSNLFEEVLKQFMKLYQRKAHVHHYTAISEFDVDSFKECQNSLNDIVQFYRDIEQMKP